MVDLSGTRGVVLQCSDAEARCLDSIFLFLWKFVLGNEVGFGRGPARSESCQDS